MYPSAYLVKVEGVDGGGDLVGVGYLFVSLSTYLCISLSTWLRLKVWMEVVTW